MHSQSACFSFWSFGFGFLSEEGRGKSGMRASERKEATVLQFAFSLPFSFSREGPWLTPPASMTPNSGMREGYGCREVGSGPLLGPLPDLTWQPQQGDSFLFPLPAT